MSNENPTPTRAGTTVEVLPDGWTKTTTPEQIRLTSPCGKTTLVYDNRR